MKWNALYIEEPSPVACMVCGRYFGDEVGPTLYCPWFDDSEKCEEQAASIRRIWGVDPYSDFAVCENCMEGCCGVVPGRNADTWLAAHIARNQNHN